MEFINTLPSYQFTSSTDVLLVLGMLFLWAVVMHYAFWQDSAQTFWSRCSTPYFHSELVVDLQTSRRAKVEQEPIKVIKWKRSTTMNLVGKGTLRGADGCAKYFVYCIQRASFHIRTNILC